MEKMLVMYDKMNALVDEMDGEKEKDTGKYAISKDRPIHD